MSSIMTNQESESRIIALSGNFMEDVEPFLMAKDRARIPEILKGRSNYVESRTYPLLEKFRSAASVGQGQDMIAVGINEREMDFLNAHFFDSMDGWPSEEELKPEDRESNNLFNQMQTYGVEVIGKYSNIVMELNSAWNRAGGTPRPSFLEFSARKSITK